MRQATIFDIIEKSEHLSDFNETYLGPKSSFIGYDTYIKSNDWRKKRQYALHVAGHQCERCGKKNIPLHVHHKHYKTLYHERIEDVEVLCVPCHDFADAARKSANYDRAHSNAFETWVSKKHGEDALDYMDEELLWEEFVEWLEYKENEYY